MTTVLYVGRGVDAGRVAATFGSDGLTVRDGVSFDLLLGTSLRCRLRLAGSVPQAHRILDRYPVTAVVVDLRGQPSGARGGFDPGEVEALLRPGDQDSWGRVSRASLVGVVDAGAPGTQAAIHLGRAGVSRVLVDPEPAVIRETLRTLAGPEGRGRVAVCLAGGGIEGMLWELGVLRALDWFLPERPLVDLDFFTGISAGSILGAFLANGLSPAEITRGLLGESTRIDPIRRRDLFDLNLGEIRRRAWRLLWELVAGGHGPRGRASSLARAVPTALFAGDGLRRWLAAQLAKPGMSDDFRRLHRPLYVGATDLDTAEPVVLGDPDTHHVPIHRAVRASSGLVPFYPAEEIDGRFLVDGAFSRTTNMRVAVERGATLVLVLDPLVPVRIPRSGYVHERGGLYAASQGIKSLIHGRFDKAVNALRETFPGVSFHLFQPEGEAMRMLGGSPMKLFFREEVEEVAFESAVATIRRRLPELARDLGRHGIALADPATPHRPILGSVPPPPLPPGLAIEPSITAGR